MTAGVQIYYIFYGNWNTFSAGTAQFPTTFKVPTPRLRLHSRDLMPVHHMPDYSHCPLSSSALHFSEQSSGHS